MATYSCSSKLRMLLCLLFSGYQFSRGLTVSQLYPFWNQIPFHSSVMTLLSQSLPPFLHECPYPTFEEFVS